jgi:hypothetical protein
VFVIDGEGGLGWKGYCSVRFPSYVEASMSVVVEAEVKTIKRMNRNFKQSTDWCVPAGSHYLLSTGTCNSIEFLLVQSVSAEFDNYDWITDCVIA